MRKCTVQRQEELLMFLWVVIQQEGMPHETTRSALALSSCYLEQKHF